MGSCVAGGCEDGGFDGEGDAPFEPQPPAADQDRHTNRRGTPADARTAAIIAQAWTGAACLTSCTMTWTSYLDAHTEDRPRHAYSRCRPIVARHSRTSDR